MSLVILFHFLCAQNISHINIYIIGSLRLCCWITASVVLFLVWRVLEFRCGWVGVVSVLQAEAACNTKNNTTDVVIQQHSRKLPMMDILMSETCWAHKKWNKKASDIKMVFYSSTITMMHGPINVSLKKKPYSLCVGSVPQLVQQLTMGWTVWDRIPVGTRFSACPDRPCVPSSLL